MEEGGPQFGGGVKEEHAAVKKVVCEFANSAGGVRYWRWMCESRGMPERCVGAVVRTPFGRCPGIVIKVTATYMVRSQPVFAG